jgi:ABC-type transporter Mla maintaining outer membrane lipid asymmetry permease subunit MlaE
VAQAKPSQDTGRFFRLFGPAGRLLIRWWLRRGDQLAFWGRLYIVALRGLGGGAVQRRIIRKLTLLQTLEIFRRTFLPLALFGFMMGVLWTILWFGVLANAPGSSMLASLLITVHLQEVTPILTTMCLIMAYCGPTIADLAVKKSSGEFDTLILMGIAPEHVLAWPRMLALNLTYPCLMLVMNLTSVAGAYWGIARAIDLPAVEFAADLYLAIDPYNMLMLCVKFLVISASIGFCCLYSSFQAPLGGYSACPYLIRRGMLEAFFYSTILEVMVTVLYA